MSQFSVAKILETEMVSVRDVLCTGECRHRSDEECARVTSLVFPYRGVFLRHVGKTDVVAEPNQVVFFNRDEAYCISHPIEGGDACLSMTVHETALEELVPKVHRAARGPFAFNKQRLRIDERTQALMALLRHSLLRGTAEALEAETLAMTLVRRAVGERTGRAATASIGLQKLVDRAKVTLSSDLARRWTLAEIAREVGVSPVYLTQVFQQVEGTPLYRYHLRLRLAKALDLLGQYDDLTALGLDLGFSSHSHFSSTFRQAYGRTPAQFQRFAGLR